MTTPLLRSLLRLPQADLVGEDRLTQWGQAAQALGLEHQAQALQGWSGAEAARWWRAAQGVSEAAAPTEPMVQAKLLAFDPEPSPDRARLACLRPAFHDALRAHHEAATPSSDQLERLQAFQDPQAPWLLGAPDDVLETPEGQVLVVYETPTHVQDVPNDPPEAVLRLHYAAAHARRAGLNVVGLIHGVLDVARWHVSLTSVAEDPALEGRLVEVAGAAWAGRVLAGQSAPTSDHGLVVSDALLPLHNLDVRRTGKDKAWSVEIAQVPRTPERLTGYLNVLAQRHAVWGLLASESEKMRDMIQQCVDQVLADTALPLDRDHLELGPSRLRLDRELDAEALEAAARRLLEAEGRDAAGIDLYLNGKNFNTEPVFSSEALAEAIACHFDVDPATDARFAAAIVKPSVRRSDTLLDLVQGLDPDGKVAPLGTLVRRVRPRLELGRAPLVGPLSELREGVDTALRQAVSPVVQGVSQAYAIRQETLKAQDAVTRPKARRKPSA